MPHSLMERVGDGGIATLILIATFGLMGSLGHCTGMCGGVTLLLTRRGMKPGLPTIITHTGRLTTYSLLGILSGVLGATFHGLIPSIQTFQGGIALITALIGIYFVLSILGKVPSPERLLSRLTAWWGKAMRSPGDAEQTLSFFSLYQTGLLWGLLPCGLVLGALLVASATASPLMGGLTMLVFGLSTWPPLFTMNWLFARKVRLNAPWTRYATASVMLLFSFQMALRSFSAWGLVNHVHIGSLMLW